MKLLTITQIAEQLGKSRQWIWFLIRTGQLKAEKVGSQFVVNADELPKLNNNNNPTNQSEERQ